MNYSQNDEQNVILKFFGDKHGRFLDIGAYDGVTYSNTRALLELGWTGVLVEPSPHNLVKLIAACQPFADRVEVVGAAVAGPCAKTLCHLQIEETPDRGWASTIADRPDRILKECRVTYRVPVLRLFELMIEEEVFDFVSIDAECMDFDILMDLPFQLRRQCRMICIEPTDLAERAEMKTYLQAIGFTVHHETPENLIAIRV